jgi:hypothetical protein
MLYVNANGNTVTMSRSPAIAVVLALGCVFSAGVSASAMAPTLRARSFAPLSISGVHFQPGERVRVAVKSGTPHVMHVRASEGGTFVAVFRGVTVERCDGLLVRAAGSKGSGTVLRLLPLMCASTNPG